MENRAFYDNETLPCAAARVCMALALFMALGALLTTALASLRLSGAALYAADCLVYVLPVAAACFVCGAKERRQTDAARPVRAPSLLLAFGAVCFLASCVGALVRRALAAAGVACAAALTAPVDPTALLLFLLRSAVLPALLEELLFRELIFRRLLPFGGRFAVFVTAALFALSHTDAPTVAAAFVFGLFFGALRLYTGGVRAGMLFHFANNAAAVGMAYLSAARPAAARTVSASAGAAGAACLLGFLLLCIYKKKPPLPPRAAGELPARAFFAQPAALLWLAASLCAVGIGLWRATR